MPDPPIRTFSVTDPDAGYIEFSIPVMSPHDVEAYLHAKLAPLSTSARFTLTQQLLEQAEEMWSGYALWIGDPVEARTLLRDIPDVQAWLRGVEISHA